MELELWLLWALLAVSLLYYLTNTTLRLSGTGRLPPGPRPLPILGNLLDLRGDLHHTLTRLARVHGPIMRLKLGLTTAVVVSSRDAAREAFTRHDRRLAARAVPDATRALRFCERSIIWLPSSDPLWKTLRGIIATHIFSPRSLAVVRGIRERKVRDLVDYFRGRAGQEVDVRHAVFSGVLNLVSNAFCSVDVVDVGAESAKGLREIVEYLIELISKPNVSDLFPFLRLLDLQGWRRWTAGHLGKIFRILDDIIDHRLAETSSSKDKQSDFLDVLLELMSTGKIGRDNLTTILFDVFTAGSDTIAITVEWAMGELLRNPRIMAKVRAEIGDTLGGKEIIEEPDAASLPYLQAVVKEAMRLHPVGPIMLPHKAVDDGIEIGGYAVPKGCTVIFNAWAIMRDPVTWERPDEFVPERFLDRAAEVDFRGKEFEFIPFGSGRRLCPGIPMAERVVPHILASLLHAFEWRLPDGVPAEQLDVSEKFTTANVMAVPLKAVPIVII
ncbi:cytochrome P450 76M5-like [Phragmites australis]|uniref:cytochrome P450 76M5-like n=1 Tax=Phragmites australis TaxID=29695 RepID=UPI002D784101|nr:cytochrome P450 76M5-like [Phragmites australis]